MRDTRLSALLAVACLAIATALAACGGAEQHAAKTSGAQTPGAVAEVRSLLAGLPQRGNALGSPRAPVIVQYFGDLECPFCRRFTLRALSTLIRRYVRTGKLRIEYRSLETATRDTATFVTQQVAALAAAKQNKMWNFLELFYREEGREDSGYVTERYLQGLAQQVTGLNLVAWTAARSDSTLAATLIADDRAARAARLTSTPSFLIGKTTRVPYIAAIEKLLNP